MLLIDKLSYQSKLRYVNASEKLVYALLTLVLCVLSRSVKVAVLVFAVNGVLTVGKGGIPFFRYIKLLMIPLAFLVIGSGDGCGHDKCIPHSYGCFCTAGRGMVYYGKLRGNTARTEIVCYCALCGKLSVFPVA